MKTAPPTPTVVVSGAFDNLRSGHLRFLEEAARLGSLTVLLWPAAAIQRLTGQPPKFPDTERLYLLSAIRWVSRVLLVDGPLHPDSLPGVPGLRPHIWAVGGSRANEAKAAHARARGVELRVLDGLDTRPFPELPPTPSAPGRRKVVVTGCYDWFHSGHVRFFEEASTYGDLYVVLGHDANIRLLKGEGHPLVPQDERRYVVGSVKFVKQALLSSGAGWLDADPEIQRLKPDLYVVNEDGDRGGKREYCQRRGIEYVVLKRTPAPGLPPRSSTDLRGF